MLLQRAVVGWGNGLDKVLQIVKWANMGKQTSKLNQFVR